MKSYPSICVPVFLLTSISAVLAAPMGTPLPPPPKISVKAITNEAAVEKYGRVLEAWYKNAWSGTVAAPTVKEATTLGERYCTAIDALRKRVQASGDLDGVLACKKEAAAVTEGSGTAPLDPKAPQELRSLRGKYEVSLQAILSKKANQTEELKHRLLATMKSMEADLTRAGKTDLAILLRARSEQMVKEGVAAQSVFFLAESWKNATPEGTAVGSPDSHEMALDANDHRGQGQLTFPTSLSKLDRGSIEGIWLRITASSNPYAGSSSPVHIWQGKKLVGQHQGLGRHWSPRIPLDLDVLSLEKSIVLDLRMAGNDGAMFWSPKSGTPPKLEIQYK